MPGTLLFALETIKYFLCRFVEQWEYICYFFFSKSSIAIGQQIFDCIGYAEYLLILFRIKILFWYVRLNSVLLKLPKSTRSFFLRFQWRRLYTWIFKKNLRYIWQFLSCHCVYIWDINHRVSNNLMFHFMEE